MNKHLLMMTVCVAALLVTPVLAADNSTITTKVTDQVRTKSAKNGKPSNVTIKSGGSIEVKVGGPALEIDSNNTAQLQSGGTISNPSTDGAIGVQLDATKAGTKGGFDSLGAIDLSGTGTTKSGILVAGRGTFIGDINLETGSTLTVVGDSSAGVHINAGSILQGDLTAGGSINVVSSTKGTGSTTGVSGIRIDGTLDGDLTVLANSSLTAMGQGAQGIVTTGAVTGALKNAGVIAVQGTNTPKSGTGNPEGASAIIIGNNIGGGILNDGPSDSSSSAATASLSSDGSSPTVFITTAAGSVAHDITIGTLHDKTNKGYSFVNRGSIISLPTNENDSSVAVSIQGNSNHTVTFTNGFFTSGTISASAKTNPTGSQNVATAIAIGPNVTIPSLTNSNQSGLASITSTISGALGGTANGILIEAGTTSVPGGNLATIINSGTLAVQASTTDTTVSTLDVYAIRDQAGTLTKIDNSGTISATATTLDDATAQKIVAADLSSALHGVKFANSGTVVGAVFFGSHDDTLNVTGKSSDSPASVTGDIDFASADKGGADTLTVGHFGTVTGAVTSDAVTGHVNVRVQDDGTLNMMNSTAGLKAGAFNVDPGGTLGLSVAQAFNLDNKNAFVGALIDADSATLAATSKLNIAFGSFIPETGHFLLIQTAPGQLSLPLAAIQNSFNVPFLYSGKLTESKAKDALTLSMALKTKEQIGLTGNAAAIFPLATVALAKDDALGAAVVANVTDTASAQSAFTAFAPDVNGATRALAISLTDQATGPVGARQRALRMYANQDSDYTLWGQEFAQNLNQQNSSESPGFRDSGFGFALGADGGNPSAGRYGGAFTFFSGDASDKQPRTSKTTLDWYMLSGYTDWRGKGFFLDTQITAGYGNLKGRRVINLYDNGDPTQPLAFSREADSKRGSLMGAGGVSTGVIYAWGSTVLTPQLSLDGLTMREDGYTETNGGDGFDLKVNPYYTNSLRGYFGTSLREDLNMGDFLLQPEARIGYRYDFLNGAQKVQAAFASDPAADFQLTGPDPARGNIVGGGSLAVTTGSWSLGLGYDFQRGTNGNFNQQGMLTLVGRI